MEKEKFRDVLLQAGMSKEDTDKLLEGIDFEFITDICFRAIDNMPKIGFLSIHGRLNCFYAVCRFLDTLLDKGKITLEESQMVFNVLRFMNKDFMKAIIAFEVNQHKLSLVQTIELPQTAKEYLSGIRNTKIY